MTLVDVLVVVQKRLWWILAGALIAGAVAAILVAVVPPSYEATSLLLITKLRSNVTLDSRFQTVAEENVVNLTIQDDQVRRQTLLSLAQSSDVMLQVLDELGGVEGAAEFSLSALKSATSATTEGNLIVLQARADAPATAAAIANAWGSVYTQHVNRLYSAISPTVAEIQQQVDEARTDYEAANTAIEEFEFHSSEGELTRQIEQKERILAGLQEDQLAAARQRVTGLLARLARFDQLLLDIQGLKTQLAGSSSNTTLSAGQKLALFTLEASAFGADTVSGYTLELSETVIGSEPVTARQAIELLDRLAATVEGAQAEAQRAIESESIALLSRDDLLTYGFDSAESSAQGGGTSNSAPEDASAQAGGPSAVAVASLISDLQAEINALQAELQGEEATRQDLEDTRAVARESYLTLERKAAETRILAQLTDVEVQVAADARPPVGPATPGVLLVAILGAAGGALAGLALAFVREFWPFQVKTTV